MLAQRSLTGASRALALPSAEETIKEVIEWILVVPAALVGKSTTPMHVLDGGFGIDVHHRRLELLGDLRELIRELLRGGYRQRRCRIGTLLCTFLAADRLGNQRSNQNAYGEGGQNRKRVSRPVRFEPI